ncbi:MAG: PDZ domain-containing protein [Acidobacteriota bacterium]
MEDQEGKFSGLGMLVAKPSATSPLLVVNPIPDTPAWRAGIRAGDVILEVDGQPTDKMSSREAVRKLKGPDGTLARRSLIGMGAVLLDGCVIEEEVIVGAGSLVPQGRVMPRGYLVMGSPARPVRPLTDVELGAVRNGWRNYVEYVAEYRRLGKFHGWADHPLQDR